MYLDQLAIPNCWLKLLFIAFIRISLKDYQRLVDLFYSVTYSLQILENKLFYIQLLALAFLNCAGPKTDHVTLAPNVGPSLKSKNFENRER